MSIGQAVRRLLGPRLFPYAGRLYRAAFVDLAKVAAALAPHLVPGAHLLDVGGGDGELLNHLLALRPDVRVTMIDLLPTIGVAIQKDFLDRVRRLPGTSVDAYARSSSEPVQAVLLSDVLHHVPPAHRRQLLGDIRAVIARNPGAVLIVKDIEPKGLRAEAAFLADRYISGDRGVTAISQRALTALLHEVFGGGLLATTDLYERDAPHYAVILSTSEPASNAASDYADASDEVAKHRAI